MIILARELRGLNQVDVAEKLKVTQGTLSKIEMGLMPINNELLKNLSKILDFPTGFFSREGKTFPPNLYYRKKVRTSKLLQTKDEALMNVHSLNIQTLLKSIDFDRGNIPNFDVEIDGSPITIAKKLRYLWQVPNGPINNLFQLIESKGIIIVLCNFASPDIDGRSMFTERGDIMIFLNSNYPIDRQRYTLAHELFHVIAHLHCSIPETRDIEKEANLFAGEFLIPEDDLRKFIQDPTTIEVLADLKRYYRMSMQSILQKISITKPLTANQQKYLWATIMKLGFKKHEPSELDPPIERPVLLKKMLNIFKNDLNYSDEEMEKLFYIKKQEINSLYNYWDNLSKFKIVA